MAHQMKCDALTGGTFAKVLHLGLTTGRLDVQAATHAAAKELESDEAALRELGGESTLRAEVGFNLYPSQYSNLRDGLMAVLLDARERTTAFFSEPTHFAVVDQRALSAILERRVKYRDELRQKILAKPDESMVMERLLLAVADWQMDHIVHPKPTDEGMAHWFQLVVRSLQHLRDPAVGFQNATYSRALEFFPGIPTCLLHNTCPPAVWALIAPMVARALGSGGRKGKGSYLAQFGHFVHMAKQGLVTAAVLDAFIDVLLVLMLYTPLEALAPNTIDKRRVDTDLLCLTIEVTGLSTAAPHVLLCTHLEGNTLPATQAAGQDADGGVRELVAQFRVLAEAVEHKGTISLGRDLHLKWTTRRRTRQPLDNLLMALAPLQVPASGQLDPAATDTQPTARQAHSPAALLAWALRGVIAAAMNTTLPNANASLVALLEARAKTHYRLPSLPVFVKATTHGVQHVGRVLQFASLDDVEASSEAAAAASDAVTAFCAAHLADLSRNQAFTSPESVLHAGATAGSNAARSALATGFAALTTLSPLFALQVTRVRRTRAQMAAAADHAVAGLAREDNGGADDGDSVVALERLAVAASVLQYEPRESVLWLITTSFTPTALAFIIANLSPALIRSYSNELQVPISPQFSDVQHLLLRIGVLYQKRLSSVEIVSNWLSEPECERVQRYLASEAATFRTTRSNFTGYTATMPLHHGIVDAAEALQYALDPGGDATAEAHRLQLRGAHQYLTGRSDSNLTFRHAITGFMAPLVAREPVQVTTAAVFRAAVRKTLEGLKNMTLDQLANLPPIVARWAGGPPGERLCDRLFVAVEQGLEESLNEHDYVHLVYIAAAQADFITPIGEPPVTLLTCVLQCSPSSVAEVHDFLRDVFPVGSEDTLQRLLQARPSPALELWRALSH